MSFDDIRRNLRIHEQRMLTASRSVMDAWGADAEQQMQTEAPWQDRPDDARPKDLPHARELLAYVAAHPTNLRQGGRGYLVQGASYGWALELAHGSRLAIIQPTMATGGPLLLARLKQEIWR